MLVQVIARISFSSSQHKIEALVCQWKWNSGIGIKKRSNSFKGLYLKVFILNKRINLCSIHIFL
jgi:hypothetical protein